VAAAPRARGGIDLVQYCQDFDILFEALSPFKKLRASHSNIAVSQPVIGAANGCCMDGWNLEVLLTVYRTSVANAQKRQR